MSLSTPTDAPAGPKQNATVNGKNIKELENLIRLRKGGLSLQRARHLMEDLRATGYNPLSKGLFVVIDSRKGRVLRISESKPAARRGRRPAQTTNGYGGTYS